MKIHLLSDLHIEIHAFYSIEDTDADVIVLAGDIDTGSNGVEWAIAEAERLKTPIIFVAGNHEFYKREYHQTLEQMRLAAEASSLVHFLEKDELVIKDVRFLGTTLWTDYKISTDSQQHSMLMCDRLINDHRLISFNEERFTTEQALCLHQTSLEWLTERLAIPFTGKTVVITHHGPSRHAAHPEFGIDALSGAFISELATLVEIPDAWLFGHTHSSVDIHLGNCRLVSNQRGYPRERVPGGFEKTKVIEI